MTRARGPVWHVVGGVDKGGILVREGADFDSAQAKARLSTGSLVEQLELQRERLHFRRLTGTGPDTGWVSTRIGSKDLLVLADGSDAETTQLEETSPGTDAGPTAPAVLPPQRSPASPCTEEKASTREGGSGRIGIDKKVRIVGLKDQASWNGKNGQIKGFDVETGRYHVKVVVLSDTNVGLKSGQETVLLLRSENLELHPDQ
ncbi:unnamed protein product, partial [Polarella glacialis]